MPLTLIWLFPIPRFALRLAFFPKCPYVLTRYIVKAHQVGPYVRSFQMLLIGTKGIWGNSLHIMKAHWSSFRAFWFCFSLKSLRLPYGYNHYTKVPMGTWGHVICHFQLQKISEIPLRLYDYFPIALCFLFPRQARTTLMFRSISSDAPYWDQGHSGK